MEYENSSTGSKEKTPGALSSNCFTETGLIKNKVR
jgi:hypothetical protein